MSSCVGVDCSFGYQTVINPKVGIITGTYRSFLEVASCIVFVSSVILNTGVLITLSLAYRSLDNLDVFFINHIGGELIASFGLAFLIFYQFASTLYHIGDVGCKFVIWLDVTSVAITVTSLIAITSALYNKLFHGHKHKLSRCKLVCCIFATWIVASLPGIPYAITTKMSNNNPQYCFTGHWKSNVELAYICAMIVVQILMPLGLLVYLLVRMRLALKIPEADDGDSVATEESTLYSKVKYERLLVKRKLILVTIIVVFFYVVHVISSSISFSIEINIKNVKSDWKQYIRMRELSALLLSLKCLFTPIIYMCYYDKLRNQMQKAWCHESGRYTTLRYSVNKESRELLTVV